MTEERFMNHINIIRNYLTENLTACAVGFIDPHDEKDAQGPTRSFLISCPNQDEKRVCFTRDFIQQNPADLPMILNRLELARYILHETFLEIEVNTHRIKNFYR